MEPLFSFTVVNTVAILLELIGWMRFIVFLTNGLKGVKSSTSRRKSLQEMFHQRCKVTLFKTVEDKCITNLPPKRFHMSHLSDHGLKNSCPLTLVEQ
jgi:hypothetical protein